MPRARRGSHDGALAQSGTRGESADVAMGSTSQTSHRRILDVENAKKQERRTGKTSSSPC